MSTIPKMPVWLVVTLKATFVLASITILSGMTIVLKRYHEFICSKHTMVVLYVSIALSLVLTSFYTCFNPFFLDNRDVVYQFEILSIFFKYIFVQCVFIMTFDSIYSLNVLLKTQEMEQNERKTKVHHYNKRFGISVFVCIALDVAVLTMVEAIMLLKHN